MPELSRTPASLGFGSRDVDDGPTAAQESTVTNSGTEPVTLTERDARWRGSGRVRAADRRRLATAATRRRSPRARPARCRARFDPSTTGCEVGDRDGRLERTGRDRRAERHGDPDRAVAARRCRWASVRAMSMMGRRAVQESTVTNSGTEPVTLTGCDARRRGCGRVRAADRRRRATARTPTTLAAGETCKVRTRFDPTTTGVRSPPTVTVGLERGGCDRGADRHGDADRAVPHPRVVELRLARRG